MANVLEKEFKYYIDHQIELVEKYDGKVVVVKGSEVIGIFEDEVEAVYETEKNHKRGTFLVQKVAPGDSAYTQTFHSRVAFS